MFLETDFAIWDHFDVIVRPIFTEIGSGNLEGVRDNVPLTIGYRRYYLLENDTGIGKNRGPFFDDLRGRKWQNGQNVDF